MKRKQYIYGLGVLFLILVLIKYLFVPSVFPPVYYIFEILSLFAVLGIIFIINRQYMLKANCNATQLGEKLGKVEKENELLKEKVFQLETRKSNDQTFLTLKDKMLSELKNTIVQYSGRELASQMFSLLKNNFELVAGIAYVQCEKKDCFEPIQNYGLDEEYKVESLVNGEGLHGQVIIEKRAIEVGDIPEDYLMASSGTGSSQPAFIYFLPLIKDDKNSLLIEIASFKNLGLNTIWNEFLDGLENIGQN